MVHRLIKGRRRVLYERTWPHVSRFELIQRSIPNQYPSISQISALHSDDWQLINRLIINEDEKTRARDERDHHYKEHSDSLIRYGGLGGVQLQWR